MLMTFLTPQWISPTIFLAGISFAEMMPGPVFNISCGLELRQQRMEYACMYIIYYIHNIYIHNIYIYIFIFFKQRHLGGIFLQASCFACFAAEAVDFFLRWQPWAKFQCRFELNLNGREASWAFSLRSTVAGTGFLVLLFVGQAGQVAKCCLIVHGGGQRPPK